MRPDYKIHRAAAQSGDRLPLLRRCTKPAEALDIDREPGKPLLCRQIMLPGQDRRRDQDGHLLAVQNRLHRRPQRDLCLTKADVAAQKPVHRRGLLHILLDLGDTAQLIVRLHIGKVLLKLRLPGRIRRKGIARAAFALGVELDQLRRHILGRFFGFGLRLLPSVRAQLVQPHRAVFPGADVFGDQIQLRGRDIEHICPLVRDLDIILYHTVQLHLLHSLITANAVIGMDNEVARRQVRKRVQLLPVGRLDGCLWPPGRFLLQQLSF